jgi:hypothetical protein
MRPSSLITVLLATTAGARVIPPWMLSTLSGTTVQVRNIDDSTIIRAADATVPVAVR